MLPPMDISMFVIDDALHAQPRTPEAPAERLVNFRLPPGPTAALNAIGKGNRGFSARKSCREGARD